MTFRRENHDDYITLSNLIYYFSLIKHTQNYIKVIESSHKKKMEI